MPNEWWKKMKPWVVQGALILSVVLLFWFGVRPLHSLIRIEMDEIQKLDVLREHKTKQLQRLPELEKQNTLIEEQGNKLNIVLTKDGLVEFIQTLERLAIETGVKIEITSKDNMLLESKITLPVSGAKKSSAVVSEEETEETETPKPVRPQRKTKDSSLIDELPLQHSIRLTLTVTAPYKAMVNYLHKIETLPYATDIIGVIIKEAAKENEEARATRGSTIASTAEDSSQPAEVSPPTFSSIILNTDFDMLVYTKE